jgi:hypothetical protein
LLIITCGNGGHDHQHHPTQYRRFVMAFPPNYNQERNNRARAKAQKALDKQQKREEKSLQRKDETPQVQQQPSSTSSKQETR